MKQKIILTLSICFISLVLLGNNDPIKPSKENTLSLPTPLPSEIEQVAESIVDAFKSGDAKLLSDFLNTSVEIATPSGEGIYSKTQAERVMQRFFTQNKPVNTTVIHKGDSNAGSSFIVLSFKTEKQNYRITVFLKQINSEVKIQEIDIVKQV